MDNGIAWLHGAGDMLESAQELLQRCSSHAQHIECSSSLLNHVAPATSCGVMACPKALEGQALPCAYLAPNQLESVAAMY